MTEQSLTALADSSDMSAALPREARLIKPSDFRNVFRKPVASADRYFKVLARSNACGRPRLGMAVSRQVDRRAVGRNRIKRVVRESFRQHFRNSRAPVDFVVLPRRETATMPNKRLSQSLCAHWTRLESRAPAATTG